MTSQILFLVWLSFVSVSAFADVECVSGHMGPPGATDGSDDNRPFIIDFDEKHFLVGDYMVIAANGQISRVKADEVTKMGFQQFEKQHQRQGDIVLRLTGNGTVDAGIEVRTPGAYLRSVNASKQTGAITFALANSGIEISCIPGVY